MIYVMGRINGNNEKYRILLEKINLKQSDELYVLGDIAGEKFQGIDILTDMSMRSNVFPILGDVEYELIKLLKSDGFNELEEEAKHGLIEYLSDMPIYDEIMLNNKKYLLLHASSNNLYKEKNLSEHKIQDFIYDNEIPDESGYTVITAHGYSDKKYISLEDLNTLRVIRLNDNAEFYA